MICWISTTCTNCPNIARCQARNKQIQSCRAKSAVSNRIKHRSICNARLFRPSPLAVVSHCGVISLQPHRTTADPPCSLHAARRDGVWVSPDPRMLQSISSRLAKVDTNPSMSFFASVRLKLGLPATQQGTSSQPTTFCSAALTVFLKFLSFVNENFDKTPCLWTRVIPENQHGTRQDAFRASGVRLEALHLGCSDTRSVLRSVFSYSCLFAANKPRHLPIQLPRPDIRLHDRAPSANRPIADPEYNHSLAQSARACNSCICSCYCALRRQVPNTKTPVLDQSCWMSCRHTLAELDSFTYVPLRRLSVAADKFQSRLFL